jgi:D-alanyl-D-alanine carboxypeptidase/D-alanyl-D-alanine-endopeptidase (penicillin-binding protein 4)
MKLILLLLLILPAHGQTLSQRIARLFATPSASQSAFWGIQVTDLATGRTIYELNADRFFVPASNTKLFTTALALTRLGPGFLFHTRVLADAQPDAAGRLAGNVRLVGGGDPNLSPRTIPYSMGPVTGDPLIAIGDLADQVALKGVNRIDGDVIGDDTWYVWQPFGNGWSIDDPLYDYGAAVSALTINDNTLTVSVRPGDNEGDPAQLLLNPPLEYYGIDNRIRTVALGGERHIHYARPVGGMTLELWGTIPLRDRGEDLLLGIEDPAQYAAMALRQALEDRGITVLGRAVARHRYPNEIEDLRMGPVAPPESGVELASRVSAPLVEDLKITDKVSQNLHAELALRAVGRQCRGVGSVQAGLEELKKFLTDAGIEPEGYGFNDGSGLARPNLVTPATVVKLLRHMYGSPLRDSFVSLLPVGGQDGTLSSRFGNEASGRIHAKTGSLAHVSALSGYLDRRHGGWAAFSILVNNYNGPAQDVRGIMDRIVALLLK